MTLSQIKSAVTDMGRTIYYRDHNSWVQICRDGQLYIATLGSYLLENLELRDGTLNGTETDFFTEEGMFYH